MAKLLLYSCLGLLTLQIGVAVLSALYFILAFLTIISNFVDVHIEQNTPPVNYVLVGLFVILLILTALLMFVTAYKESKKICKITVGLMVIILVIFMVTSIISFINKPSLTKYVCMYDGHCPESLWLAGFRYRRMQDVVEDNYTDTTTATTPTNNTKPHKRDYYLGKNLGRGYMEEDLPVLDNEHPKRKAPSERSTGNTEIPVSIVVLENDDHPKRKAASKRNNTEMSVLPVLENDDHLKRKAASKGNNTEIPVLPVLENNDHPKRNNTEVPVLFPIRHSSVNKDSDEFQMTDFLKIIKRSLSSMGRYSSEGLDEPVELTFQRRNSRVVNSEPTTPAPPIEIEDEEESEDSGGGYIVGPDLFMAIILFLITSAFFIFTILVLWSYKTQLKYVQLYAFHPESQPQIT